MKRARFWFEIFQFLCIIGVVLLVGMLLVVAFSTTLIHTTEFLKTAVDYIFRGAFIALMLSVLNYYKKKIKL